MTITIAAALAGLAVIDSTSIGTLVVPLWMLVHPQPVSYTHLRAHETVLDLVCRLLLQKRKHTPHNILNTQ